MPIEDYLKPETQEDVQKEGVLLQPNAYFQEGNNSIYNFSLLANQDQQLLIKQNLSRKRMTIQNIDSTNSVQISRTVIVNGKNQQQYITIVAGASVIFEEIERGEFVKCANMNELHQIITQCEFLGALYMNNPNGAPVNVEVFESG